jgi:hypothetical protein
MQWKWFIPGFAEVKWQTQLPKARSIVKGYTHTHTHTHTHTPYNII